MKNKLQTFWKGMVIALFAILPLLSIVMGVMLLFCIHTGTGWKVVVVFTTSIFAIISGVTILYFLGFMLEN